MFSTSRSLVARFALQVFLLAELAWAQAQLDSSQNLTIDDNSFLIRYTGLYSWEPAVDLPNRLDYGGYHTVSTKGDTDAQAILSFNGTAVYFWSPLWPWGITVDVSVDGGTVTTIDLRDYSAAYNEGGSETAQSIPRWGVYGLSNGPHTLVVSMTPGGAGYVVSDGYTYTVEDSSTSPTTPTSIIASSTSDVIPSTSSSSYKTSILPSATGDSTTSAHHNHTVARIGGGVAGGIACIGLFILCCFFCKRRNTRHPRAGSASNTSLCGSAPVSVSNRATNSHWQRVNRSSELSGTSLGPQDPVYPTPGYNLPNPSASPSVSVFRSYGRTPYAATMITKHNTGTAAGSWYSQSLGMAATNMDADQTGRNQRHQRSYPIPTPVPSRHRSSRTTRPPDPGKSWYTQTGFSSEQGSPTRAHPYMTGDAISEHEADTSRTYSPAPRRVLSPRTSSPALVNDS